MKIEYKYEDYILQDQVTVQEYFMNDNPLDEVPEVKDKMILEFEQTCKPHLNNNHFKM